jgi:hypothetical protein
VGSSKVPARSWVSLGKLRRFENEMLKVEKWFMILYFPKIKEKILVKRKKKFR